jgi:hypothetical protein
MGAKKKSKAKAKAKSSSADNGGQNSSLNDDGSYIFVETEINKDEPLFVCKAHHLECCGSSCCVVDFALLNRLRGKAELYKLSDELGGPRKDFIQNVVHGYFRGNNRSVIENEQGNVALENSRLQGIMIRITSRDTSIFDYVEYVGMTTYRARHFSDLQANMTRVLETLIQTIPRHPCAIDRIRKTARIARYVRCYIQNENAATFRPPKRQKLEVKFRPPLRKSRGSYMSYRSRRNLRVSLRRCGRIIIQTRTGVLYWPKRFMKSKKAGIKDPLRTSQMTKNGEVCYLLMRSQPPPPLPVRILLGAIWVRFDHSYVV